MYVRVTRIRVGFLVAALAAVTAGGVAYATGGSGVIHGCYKVQNGQLRVVAAHESCLYGERAIEWNQGGPTGPQGPVGAKGPTGDKGAPGYPGQKGPDGAKGPTGDKGAAGDKGLTGDKGATGDKGLTGDKGATGDKGPLGDKGPTGDPGPLGTIGQDVGQFFGTGNAIVNADTAFTVLPGLDETISVPANSIAYISADGALGNISESATGSSVTDIVVLVDGGIVLSRRVACSNTPGLIEMICQWGMSAAFTLPEGSHTLAVEARGGGVGQGASVSGDDTSELQGRLTVLVLKK